MYYHNFLNDFDSNMSSFLGVKTGREPNNASGEVSADQYHHYKVSWILVFG